MDVSKVEVTGELYQILERLYVWETEYGNFVFEGPNAEYPQGTVKPHVFHTKKDKTLVDESYTYPLYISSDHVVVPSLEKGDADTPKAGTIYLLPDQGVAFYLSRRESTSPHLLNADADPELFWSFCSISLEPWQNDNVSEEYIQDDALLDLFENNHVLHASLGV
jgi:hypothetical protein